MYSQSTLQENKSAEDKIISLIDTADPEQIATAMMLADSSGMISMIEEDTIKGSRRDSYVYRFYANSAALHAGLSKLQYTHQGNSFRTEKNMAIEVYSSSIGSEVYLRVYEKNQKPTL
tara:strand:+ start:78 stop:431 length:354 start_codon:yes stop_codon:yes gene_type:complete